MTAGGGRTPGQQVSLKKAQAERRRIHAEGMAAAREWRERHRRLGTVWGIPPQPMLLPCCPTCGKPVE